MLFAESVHPIFFHDAAGFRPKRGFGLATLLVAAALLPAPHMNAASQSPVYIGTYTGQKREGSKGIYLAYFDERTGQLSAPSLAAATVNPSFLAMHPNGRFLYAVGEQEEFRGKKSGVIKSFAIAPDGSLTLINQRASEGTGPCHLSVARGGKVLLVANYGSGSVAAFPLDAHGEISPAGSVIQHAGSSLDRQRQAGPHAHFITPDPSARYALACDLGLDKVLVYRLDRAAAKLTPNEPPSGAVPPGAGPRHLVFHPSERWAYVVNEMGNSITRLDYQAKTGILTAQETVSTLPPNFTGKSYGAEIQMHPKGRFLYASNRGDNSLAGFAIDKRSGELKSIGFTSTAGKTPRHFTFSPSGNWLLVENQDSNDIEIFSVNSRTGRLEGPRGKATVGSPVCLVFRPGKG